jgi:methylenetetrahydrofolate--tRNA-(uracil-5-)-methyltransferase
MSTPSPSARPRITVIGAGMAGSDAALAAAELGVAVDLFEMRPKTMTPAHHSDKFAELVCSNSFGGESETNAKGLLQAEMLVAGGLVMRSAHANRVPAGGALAVDRDAFSRRVTPWSSPQARSPATPWPVPSKRRSAPVF